MIEQIITKKEKSGAFNALQLAWSLGYTIAVPLVALALVGRLIDKKWDTSPWFLMTGILLSIIISSCCVWFKVAKIISETSDQKNPKP